MTFFEQKKRTSSRSTGSPEALGNEDRSAFFGLVKPRAARAAFPVLLPQRKTLLSHLDQSMSPFQRRSISPPSSVLVKANDLQSRHAVLFDLESKSQQSLQLLQRRMARRPIDRSQRLPPPLEPPMARPPVTNSNSHRDFHVDVSTPREQQELFPFGTLAHSYTAFVHIHIHIPSSTHSPNDLLRPKPAPNFHRHPPEEPIRPWRRGSGSASKPPCPARRCAVVSDGIGSEWLF